jgi:hypothetical protein
VNEHRVMILGDELIPDPATKHALAEFIYASADEVWPWVRQMGRGRAGLYSYEWIENLFGLDLHNASEIRDEWRLGVGDRVELVRKGWPALKAGYSLPVAEVDDEKHVLVLRQQPPEHPWNAVWTFFVVPMDDQSCLLVSHSRVEVSAGLSNWKTKPMECVTDFMTRGMLRGIKKRAELSGRYVAAPKRAPTP